MSGLGNAGVRAFKWSAISTIVRFALQFLAQIVLARLLGPENYGIFGIGMVVYTFSNFLVGFGFGWSLLQRATLTDDDIRFAFTWQVIAGSVAMLGLYFSAPLLADYFHDARAQPVIQWMALACLLSAAASPASNLLQRDLNFKRVGLIQVASYACGYLLVGIPLALLGFAVNSLVAAWLTQASVSLIANYAAKPHTLRPLFWYPGAKSAFGTGGTVFVTNIVNWSLNNLDRVFIGRVLNTRAVGLYTAGYNIANMPNSLLLSALQPAFMAAAAKMQTEPQRLSRAYLQMLAVTWVLILPFFVFLALIAADLVQLLYGPKWSEAASVMAILFLGMPAYVMWGVSTPVLWNANRKQYECLLQIPILCLGALGFYAFTGHGIAATAIVASLLLVVRAAVVGAVALKAVGLSLKDLVPHVMRGFLLSTLSAIGAIGGHYLASTLAIPFVTLATSSLLTLALVLLSIRTRPQILGGATIEMLVRFVPRLAGPLKYESPASPP